jgi:hypothetical protein
MSKTYQLKFEVDDEGKTNAESKVDGFSWPEIIGILEWKKLDIMRQIAGYLEPDYVKRERVVDEYPEGYGEGGVNE